LERTKNRFLCVVLCVVSGAALNDTPGKRVILALFAQCILIRFSVDRSFQFPGRLEKYNAPRWNVYRGHSAGIVHCAGFPFP
jgi:hypothetical protein